MNVRENVGHDQHQNFNDANGHEAVLIATLIDSPQFLQDVRATGLLASDFFSPPLRIAFEAVLSLGESGDDVSMENIAGRIRRLHPEYSEDVIDKAAYVLPMMATTTKHREVDAVIQTAKHIVLLSRGRQLGVMLSEQSQAALQGTLPNIVASEVITKTIELVSSEWPTPQPLADVLPPVMALDLELLPPLAATFVADVARRTSSPPDMTASMLVVGIGGTIGRRLAIKMKHKDSWCEFSNIWGMLVASPGAAKTPATKPVMTMMDTVENEQMREWYQAEQQRSVTREEITERQKILGKEIAAAIKDSSDLAASQTRQIEFASKLRQLDVPKPRFVIRDATPESLLDLFRGSPSGIVCIRDELSGFFAELDKTGRESLRSLFVSGWNGNSRHTMDRRQAASVDVDAVTISLFGNIQPGPLRELVLKSSRGIGDDGFLQRFSFAVFPDAVAFQHLDMSPNQVAADSILKLFRGVAAFPAAPAGKEPVVTFASHQWPKHVEALARSQRSQESPALQSWWSKINKPFAAIALIGHLFRYQGELAECLKHPICDEDAERAKILVVDYLASHARRIFAGVDVPADNARHIGKLIEHAELGHCFTARDLQQRNNSRFKDALTAEAALVRLAAAGWVRMRRIETKGRTSEVWEVSPHILAGHFPERHIAP